MGYQNPPRFRDGMDVDKPLPEPAIPTQAETEKRLKELEELEKPRMAYVDPKLAKPTLAAVAPPTLATVIKQPDMVKPSGRGTTDNTFAKLLRAARLDAGYSQGALGKKINTHQTVISKWENIADPSLPIYETYTELRKILPTLPDFVPGMMGKAVYEAKLKEEEAKKPKVIPVPPPKPYVPPARESVRAEVMTTQESLALTTPQPPAPPPAPAPAPAPVEPTGQEEYVTVKLRSGGTITLKADVNLFKLKGEDRAFVFTLIDQLQAYEEGGKK
jgi:transcriptional regulator with XRE-family HTH domain